MPNAMSKLPKKIQEKYTGILPVPVVSIANDLELKVYETDTFDDSQSGSIAYNDKLDEYRIYVNKKHSNTRKRFSIAHEIAHFIKHKDVIKKVSELVTNSKTIINGLERSQRQYSSKEEAKIEKEANEFAAELLMPKKEFEQVFNEANDIFEVANKFNVSQSAATVRAHKLLGQFFT